MKKYIIIALIHSMSYIYVAAQVTINTGNSPTNTAFYIDTKGDGTLNTSDDVFISNTGNIGIGTTSPSTKLDIKGNIRIADGAASTDHVFTSVNTSGLGIWKELSIVKNYVVWKVSASNVASMAAGVYYSISGTSSISLNTLNATTNGSSNLVIPAGKYLFFIQSDINVREYGRVYVFNGGTQIFFKWYSEYLGGGTFYKEFTSPATLTMGFTPTDVRSNSASAIPFLNTTPYTNVNIWASLIIMEL